MANNQPHTPHSHLTIRTHLDVTGLRTPEAVAEFIEATLLISNVALLITTREQQSPTGMKGRIAIPHCRIEGLDEPVVSVLRLSDPVDFSGPDGPADVVFFIGVPAGGDKAHMKILSSLARAVVRTSLVDDIRGASDGQQVEQLVRAALVAKKKTAREQGEGASGTEVAGADKSAKESDSGQNSSGGNPVASPRDSEALSRDEVEPVRIVAITSCPTGVAHTYMAADALVEAAAGDPGVVLAVETQGVSANRRLTDREIADADVAIVASAVSVSGEDRWAHLPVVRVDARRAVDDPAGVLAQAKQLKGSSPEERPNEPGWGSLVSRALLSAVSMVLPALMVSGLLMGVAGLMDSGVWSLLDAASPTAFGGNQMHSIASALAGAGSLAEMVFALGVVGLAGAPAVMAMAVSSTIAPRVGAVPGLLVGLLAVALGTGWLGAVLAGFLAGCCARALNAWKAPPAIAPVVPLLLIPSATAVVAGIVACLAPALRNVYNAGLAATSDMPTALVVLFAVILGVAMNVDFGGRVNKVAYGIAVVGLTTASGTAFNLMAAVMAAGMVAPLSLSVARLALPRRVGAVEPTAWLSGLFFITEPAVSFVKQHPRAVWPLRVGGAVAAAVSVLAGTTTVLPHGGIVAALGSVTGVAGALAWLGAIAAGVAVGAAGVVGVVKK